MIVLRVEVFGRRGRGEEVAAVFREMATLVRALEPDCVRYDVARSRERPDDLVVWEIYRSQEAFEAHRVTPHFARLMQGELAAMTRGRLRSTYELITELAEEIRSIPPV